MCVFFFFQHRENVAQNKRMCHCIRQYWNFCFAEYIIILRLNSYQYLSSVFNISVLLLYLSSFSENTIRIDFERKITQNFTKILIEEVIYIRFYLYFDSEIFLKGILNWPIICLIKHNIRLCIIPMDQAMSPLFHTLAIQWIQARR